VLDYACSRELDATATAARGTGLDDGRCRPAKATQRRAIPATAIERDARAGQCRHELLLGQQMLPGHYGAVSHALLQAQNLRQALDILCEFHARCVRC
jgi:hypothetical protein